jgi:twitching motility protein PilI
MVNLDLSMTTDQVQVAQEFQQQLEVREGELHLRFYVNPTQELALPAIVVREVISAPLDRITPIPNTSPLLLGTLNLRGRVIWVADLSQLLGEPTVLNTERPEIPVIAVEEQDILVGLAVEQIVAMEWLDVEELQLQTQVSESMAPFIRGEWVLNEQTHQCLRLLDQKAILQSERWAA